MEGLLAEPPGRGEIHLHAEPVGHSRSLSENGFQSLGRKSRGAALLPHGSAGGNEPRAGHIPHAQGVDEPQGLGILGIDGAKGRVHRHNEPRLHGVADAPHRVLKTVSTHKGVVNSGVSAIKGHLHAVEAGLIEVVAQLGCQQPTIGVEAGDKPRRSLHQLHQVLPHGGLTACERHLGNIGLAELRKEGFPLLCGKFCHLAHGLSCRVAVETLLVAVPAAVLGHGGDHNIHAVGRGHLRGVFSQGDGLYLRLRLFATGNGGEGAEHQV